MNYKDDGSTVGGMITVALCLLCLFVGYKVRDQGITFKVETPPIQRGVR